MTQGPAPDPELDAWLRAGAGAGDPVERVATTPGAWVYLYPRRALKLKRPVDFGFLNFTTEPRRREATQREYELNRRAAGDLYRGVRRVARAAAGGFSLDGNGETVDWLLEMRRFPDGATAAEAPERLTPDLAERLGRDIARLQAGAERANEEEGAECLAYVLGSNAKLLRALAREGGTPSLEQVDALDRAGRAAFARLRPLMLERGRSGLVRRCHGDLHLGNILIEDGRAVMFDCIEFNHQLARIDVLYDLAFLLMDLHMRGLPEAASRALNGWLDQAAREEGEGPWAGLTLLPFLMSVRAQIRAFVEARSGEKETARRYFRAAEALLQPASAPTLTAVGGMSGSGKTTFARAHAPGLGPAPGAVVLRSDEVRKRLAGCDPLERAPADAYAPEASDAVYAELMRTAETVLGAGRSVVVDAAFLEPARREAVQALALRLGCAFDGIWLESSPEMLRARVAARRGDASDADVGVLEGQLSRDLGAISWRPASLESLLGR